MFDENKNIESDILMRSILSEAQEDVPAHIWEGISSELDRLETVKARKPVLIWFRRSAIAVAAAAAVAAGVFADWNKDDTMSLQPSPDGMIAVADTQKPQGEEIFNPSDKHITATIEQRATTIEQRAEEVRENFYLADAEEEVRLAEHMAQVKATEAEPAQQEQRTEQEMAKQEQRTEQKEYFPENWPEDDVRNEKKQRVSVTLSGLAGTNSTRNKASSPLRRPQMSTAKPKTGVVQKSKESTYGLPISFGAGVKIGLSENWSIGTGVDYTILTKKFYGTYTLVNNVGSIENSVTSDVRNIQQYIGIPINAFYNIVAKDNLNFYAYAGGTIEKCISDKYEVLNTEFTHTDKVKNLQLSANLGIGVEFLLGRHLGLYIDPSLRYYFDCNQPASIRTAQPLMLGLEMGLRVRL